MRTINTANKQTIELPEVYGSRVAAATNLNDGNWAVNENKKEHMDKHMYIYICIYISIMKIQLPVDGRLKCIHEK